MLRLDDHWVWDSWIADDGDRYHLFFLKAPRALGSPGHRHTHAVIGHAVSADLVDWDLLPDALGPLKDGWDDLALWTGSVARGDDGVWRLYYTAINTGGHEVKDQRVGLAESDDLLTWRRVGEQPLVGPGDRWYKTLDEDSSASETWRDPLVFRVDGEDGWHMYVTARVVGSPRNADGVLAHATSPDMRRWTLQEPICAPAGFGQIEVPQVKRIGGSWVLAFTCHPDEQSPEQRERYGDHSTWSLVAESPLGPWDLDIAQPFEAEPELFAAPLVQQRDGSWALIGFRNLEPQGIDAFEILDPIRVVLQDGRLVKA